MKHFLSQLSVGRTRLITLSVLACLWLLHSENAASGDDGGEIRIGAYLVPRMAGWTMETYSSDLLQSSKYRRKVERVEVTLKMVYFPLPKGAKPVTQRQDLVDLMRQNRPRQQAMYKSFGIEARTIKDHPTDFRGLPAYVVEWRLREQHREVHTRAIYFLDGGTTYLLHMVVSGPKVTREAQKLANEAWAAVEAGLRRAAR